MPVISTNTAANTAVRYLNINSTDQSESLAKLASGSRITKASDDAAGLAIATKISSDVSSLEQASTNASHGISILQTADGGAANISDILERMKTLASQSASGTVTDTERTYIEAEFSQLVDEIDGIATSTRYNGQSLLDGTSDFADDTTTTAATVTSSLSGATTASSSLTSSSTIAATAGDTLSFDVNGTSVSLTAAGTTITADDIVDAINAQSETTGVTASVDASGMTLTSADGSDITIDNVTGTGTTLSSADLTTLGLTDTDSDGTETYSAADVLTVSDGEEVTFDVNGTTVTLSNDTSEDVGYTAAELVSSINAALVEDGNYDVEASLDADTGALTFTSRTSGEKATVAVDNLTGSLDGTTDFALSDLGLTTATASATGTSTDADTTGSQIIVGSDASDSITLTIKSLTSTDLGIADLNVSTQAGAEEALSVLDTAIDTVSNARAEMGATMSRFEFRSSQIDTSIENLEAAESAISDVDIASEQASLSASSVKVQAAVAAAAQANQMPQNLLSLLQ
ncbi:flagellin [Breoghania corrubedonensis]|uniref:Flagellin n=1 Tax=Breoghania corrubedonensis TaxID=665038 RepID=A0A2T5V6G3_9HYPH|nr:flagellin [Breoghania corrubedonensis]PTW59337.1 flagellin [Breoghania corrubedonensis]